MNRAELKANARARLGNNIFDNKWLMALLVCLIASVLTTAINGIPGVGTVAALIIAGPIAYGATYIFLKQSRDGEPVALENLFKGFSDDFAGLFLLNLLVNLFTILWTLLFIVPGIVKGIGYSMAYYVKIDHPEMNANECIKESSRIMYGHKWEYFVLILSFIGWLLVGALCFGIGTLWVAPYIKATEAEFYKQITSTTVNQ